jgi:hypothetical protein
MAAEATAYSKVMFHPTLKAKLEKTTTAPSRSTKE